MATTTSPTHRRATCGGPRATWGAPSACGTTGAARVSGAGSVGHRWGSAGPYPFFTASQLLFPFSPPPPHPLQPRPGSPWRRTTRRRTTCESFLRRKAAAGRQGHYVYTVQTIYLIFIKIKRSLFISLCYADAERRLLAVPAHIPCAAPCPGRASGERLHCCTPSPPPHNVSLDGRPGPIYFWIEFLVLC